MHTPKIQGEPRPTVTNGAGSQALVTVPPPIRYQGPQEFVFSGTYRSGAGHHPYRWFPDERDLERVLRTIGMRR